MPKATTSTQFAKSKNERLYQALIKICKFSKPEDISILKEEEFLKICDLAYIHARFEDVIFQGLLDNPIPENLQDCLHNFTEELSYNQDSFGTLTFSAHSKISVEKKKFLKKISHFISSSLHFIKNKVKLEESKEQWDLVFDSFYRGLCITDKNFRMLRTNQVFRQLCKKKKSDIYGQDILAALPIEVKKPEDTSKAQTWVSHGSAEGQALSLEFFLQTIWLTNEKIPFKLFLIKDITQEARLEKEISNQAQAKELGFIKGSIAHELNNPIAGIKALLSTMEHSLKDSSSQEVLKEMLLAIDRCEKIVKSLLAASYSPNKLESIDSL